MTELDLIVDLHRNMHRQGPGCVNGTLKALSLTGLSNCKNLSVADIGCGTGGQTVTLAKHLSAQILAIDLFQPFLDQLAINAQVANVENKIRTVKASMHKLPLEPESLDLIWSEGAIYIMGFEEGVVAWKDYLKPDGILAVSEITWTTDSRPKEIQGFWQKEYAQIDQAAAKIAILEKHGYAMKGYFQLSSESWLNHYYVPLEAQFPLFLSRHNESEMACSIVEQYLTEIDMYKRYQDYFSYGFYIANKITRSL